MTRDDVLDKAKQIINGDRRESYGDVVDGFVSIATGWEVILGASVSARQVALCMIWLKVCRESNKASFDNLVDICGYAALGEELP